MSDIFLSYASDDRERILPLVRALEKTGWSIFWDKTIPAGKTWRQVIGNEIKACRCVLVVWTKISVNKEWVLEEAEVGKKEGKLIPVLLDDVDPPFGFAHIQAADLISWDGLFDNPTLQKLLTALSYLLGTVPAGQAVQHKIPAIEALQPSELEKQAGGEAKKAAKATSPTVGEKKKTPHIARQVTGGRYLRYVFLVLTIVIALGVVLMWDTKKEPEQAQLKSNEQEAARILQEQELARRKKAEETEIQQWKEEAMRREARIAELLGRAREAVTALRLTSPPDENAVIYYREVLALAPQNPDAQQGLEQIVGKYVTWAEQALQKRQADKAEDYLNKARLVEPMHVAIAEMAQKIERFRIEQEEAIRSRAALEAERKKAEELQREESKTKETVSSADVAESEESKSETKLDADELRSLIPGKTVEGRYIKWGTELKMYFDPSGSMRRIDSLNNREKGRWRIDEDGRLCLEVRKENCNRVKRRADGGYNVYRGGILRHTYDRILDGNPYNL